MKLQDLLEIFDDEYYDYLQSKMNINQQPEQHEHDTETSIQDFIISAFEQDQMTYEEAEKRIRDATPPGLDLDFWLLELHMAKEYKEG